MPARARSPSPAAPREQRRRARPRRRRRGPRPRVPRAARRAAGRGRCSLGPWRPLYQLARPRTSSRPVAFRSNVTGTPGRKVGAGAARDQVRDGDPAATSTASARRGDAAGAHAVAEVDDPVDDARVGGSTASARRPRTHVGARRPPSGARVAVERSGARRCTGSCSPQRRARAPGRRQSRAPASRQPLPGPPSGRGAGSRRCVPGRSGCQTVVDERSASRPVARDRRSTRLVDSPISALADDGRAPRPRHAMPAVAGHAAGPRRRARVAAPARAVAAPSRAPHAPQSLHHEPDAVDARRGARKLAGSARSPRSSSRGRRACPSGRSPAGRPRCRRCARGRAPRRRRRPGPRGRRAGAAAVGRGRRAPEDRLAVQLLGVLGELGDPPMRAATIAFRAVRVLCLGEALVDLVCERPVRPVSPRPTRSCPTSAARWPTWRVAARRRGGRAGRRRRGDDPWGRWLRERLAARGRRPALVRARRGPRGRRSPSSRSTPGGEPGS